jgi:hypothetical protein
MNLGRNRVVCSSASCSRTEARVLVSSTVEDMHSLGTVVMQSKNKNVGNMDSVQISKANSCSVRHETALHQRQVC